MTTVCCFTYLCIKLHYLSYNKTNEETYICIFQKLYPRCILYHKEDRHEFKSHIINTRAATEKGTVHQFHVINLAISL